MSRLSLRKAGHPQWAAVAVELDVAVVFGNDYYEKLEELTDKNRKDIPMGIGDDCVIEEAIIDKNVHIGKGVSIKGGGKLKDRQTKNYCIVDGVVVIRKGAVIKDGTVIGRRK